VVNLLENAARYNEPGGELWLTAGAEDGVARLTVVNCGPHVPDEAIPRLFEPFQRLNGRTADGGGLGLGLTIVRSIAAVHHGAVSAHARAGGGLAVTVTLPGVRPT